MSDSCENCERLRAEVAALNQPVKLSEWQELVAERDRLRELLRDINTYGIDGLHVGHPLRNRIDAALKEGS